MRPSKLFLLIVTILIGLTLQLIPLMLTADSPKVIVGFPLPFIWEGPNEVYIGAYTFEKEYGFSVAKLLFDFILFIGSALILEVKLRKSK